MNRISQLLLILLLAYTNVSWAQKKEQTKKYCTADSEDVVSVNIGLAKLSPQHQEDFKKQKEAFQKLGQKTDQFRQRIFILTRQDVSLGEFDALKKEFNETRNNFIPWLVDSHKSARELLVGMTEAYFQLISRLIEIEIMVRPFSQPLTYFYNDYALKLALDTYNKIYPFGTGTPPGTDLYYSSADSKSEFVFLTLSKQVIYSKMLRAAAQSAQTRSNKTQYFETVKCALSRLLLGKTQLNQSLIQAPQSGISLPNDFKACLNTPAEEIIKMNEGEMLLRREALLRAKVQEVLPQPLRDLPADQVKFYLESGISAYYPTLYIYPDSLAYVNYELKLQTPIKDEQIATLTKLFQDRTDSEYTKNPALHSLKGFWRSKELELALNQVVTSCPIKLEITAGQKLSVNEVMQRMSRLEDFNYISFLQFDLDQLSHKLTEISNDQMKEIFYQYFLSRKKKAIYQSLLTSIGKFLIDDNLDILSLIALIQFDLDPIIEAQFKKATADGKLNSYIDQLVLTVQSNKKEAISFKTLLISFTQSMIGAANEIDKFLNPQTPVANLPYEQKAVFRAVNYMIQSLTPDLVARFKNLTNQQEFAIQKSLFLRMKEDINARSANLNINCETVKKPGTDYGRFARSFFVADRKDTAEEIMKRTCYNFQTIQAVLNYEGSGPFASVSEMLVAAKRVLQNDEYIAFEKLYREELAADIFAEYRMLEMVVGTRKFWPMNEDIKMYEVLTKYDEKSFDENVLPLEIIKNGVSRSLVTLNQHLKALSQAKKDADFSFFITRTKVINAFLGDNEFGSYLSNLNGAVALETAGNLTKATQEQGYVFPHLLDYHFRLQNELVQQEDVHSEVFDEFITTNVYISMWMLGGYAAKHVLGVFPNWTQLPKGASLTNALLKNMSATSTNFGNYFLGLLTMQIGGYFKQAHDFNTELQHIKDLNQSETLAPEGIENPIPLIAWQDYTTQKTLFESSISSAYWGAAQSAGWLIYPLLINKSFQFAADKFRDLRVSRAKKVQNLSPNELKAYERGDRRHINHKLKLLSLDFQNLKMKPPYNMDIDNLYGSMKQASNQTKSKWQKDNIKESYEEIVYTVGRDLDKIAGHLTLQQIYAKALLGPNGSVSQLVKFHNEFKRIAGAP